MINFRFHLVSLIAVFLALGLGILVGSSVVDRVIVNRLDDEIKSVRHESSERNRENKQLSDRNSELNKTLNASWAFAIDRRLTAVPLAIVVDKGVNDAQVKALFDMARRAGAQVPGILWLEDKWRLDTPAELTELQDAASVTGNAAAARSEALAALAARLTTPPRGRRPTSDVLTELQKARFLTLQQGDAKTLAAFPARAGRVLVITGTDSHLTVSATMVSFVRALADDDVPVVVTEVFNGQSKAARPRGSPLAPVRGDSSLSKLVSTVDDGESTQGGVAAMIALEQAAQHTVGHYGHGSGATAPLPAHAS
jgi:hypothetical protein